MRITRRLSKSLLLATGMLLLTAAVAVAAYLHLANAQTYAKQHAWTVFCGSSSRTCPNYPNATGWYQRVSNTKVRVEIHVYRAGSGNCYRIFAVTGDDSSPQITSDGSSAFWSCS